MGAEPRTAPSSLCYWPCGWEGSTPCSGAKPQDWGAVCAPAGLDLEQTCVPLVKHWGCRGTRLHPRCPGGHRPQGDLGRPLTVMCTGARAEAGAAQGRGVHTQGRGEAGGPGLGPCCVPGDSTQEAVLSTCGRGWGACAESPSWGQPWVGWGRRCPLATPDRGSSGVGGSGGKQQRLEAWAAMPHWPLSPSASTSPNAALTPKGACLTWDSSG